MQRRLVQGAALLLVSALTFSPVGAASPRTCDLASNTCSGLLWGGPTSQPHAGGTTGLGGVIQFLTDPSKGWVANFQWAIAGEHCVILPGVTTPIGMGYGVTTAPGWQVRVVDGHFSKSAAFSPPVFRTHKFPSTVVWHLTGALSGNQASGTMRWAFAGANRNACTPTSGSFTWHTVDKGAIGNA